MVDDKKAEAPALERIAFNYQRSPHFRHVYAEGAFGGGTPRGLLEMSFYTEHKPLPDRVIHPINKDGKLGPELVDERVIRGGLLREVQVSVIVPLSVAKSLHTWLTEKIGDMERAGKES